MSELKIEAGKYYKTRDGRKAFVGGIVYGSPFREAEQPWVVCYLDTHDGKWNFNLKGEAQGLGCRHMDLIEEWKEPVSKVVTVVMRRSQTGTYTYFEVYESEPNAKVAIAHPNTLGSCQVRAIEGQHIKLPETP